ncbi:hypothetical protein DDR33_23415 [Pararcticibacter amylolyticus]|uniref:Outer membrane protein beta-barrel domain-containing protein n=2 Tax=Pararcticibacter amylolyticus TaxID=2173175 RepID=A0A2U2PA39_9SPHI|nr:hypothetical protein DDR33_23415 [Pararcticibacter amylolyticus]
MLYKKKILFICVFNCFYSLLFAQKATVIYGMIVDSSGSCVESATVSLIRLPDSISMESLKSSKDGLFHFNKVPRGEYCVIAAYVGHNRSLNGPYHIRSADTLIYVRVTLTKQVRVLDEVEVHPGISFVEQGPGKTVLNVDKMISSSGNSAFDVLRRAPGILISQDGSITMRGRQGVTLSMDGKAVTLSSADVVELLKNTSAELLDKIELISNPSSAYDASGTGGVINLKLKKNKSIGTNATFSAGTGYGENYKFNSSILLNHRQKAFNIYASWALNDSKRTDRYFLKRAVGSGDVRTSFNVSNHDIKSVVNHNLKAGADFYLSGSQTIGFMYTGAFNRMYSDEDNNTLIGHGLPGKDSLVLTYSDEKRAISNNAFNLNYKFIFDVTSSLNIDFDYLRYTRRSDEALLYYFYADGTELYGSSQGLMNRTPSHIGIRSAKLDYSKTFGAGINLQSGLKSSFVSNDSKRLVSDIDDEPWLKQSFVPDESDFKEYIHAAYGNLSKEYPNKTRIEAGVRGEYTRTFSSSRSGSSVKKSYFNLFPSLSLSAMAAPGHRVSLAYNRRISRPAYDDLNPFRYFLDQYTYREGNPYLRPEYSQSLELSDVYKDNFTVTLSCNAVKDYYLTFALQNDTTRISSSVKRNLDWFKSVGAELIYRLAVARWLSSDLNLQGYIRRFKSDEVLSFLRNSSYFAFSSVNSIKFRKKYTGQCNFSYESPTVSGMFNFKPVYVLDLGVGRSVLNNNGVIRVSLSDVFNSDRSRYYSGLSQLALSGNQKTETRVVRVNLSYKLGSKSAASGSARDGSNDSERKRVVN